MSMNSITVELTEESDIKYGNMDELSYYDMKSEKVELFVKGMYIGDIEVFTDRENEEREYICVNYEMIYLDTITCLNPNE